MEKGNKLDNLQEATAAYKPDTKCNNCGGNKATGYCCQCKDYLCTECQALHKKVRLTKNHNIVFFEQGLAKEGQGFCQIHPEAILINHCKTCKELVCNECTKLHKDHELVKIEEVLPQCKMELLAALKPAKKKLQELEQALVGIENRQEAILAQKAEVEQNIEAEINKLEQLIQQQRAKCLGNVESLTQQKLLVLNEQRKHAESAKAKLSHCMDQTNRGMTSAETVLVEKENFLEGLQKAVAESDIVPIEPEAVADVELVTNDIEGVQNVLEVVETGSVSLEYSRLIENGMKDSKTMMPQSVIFQAMSLQNKPYERRLHITAELAQIDGKRRLKCGIEKEPEGRYKITYQPVKKGKHKLQVVVNGNQIRGSPFSISVGPGKPLRVIEGLQAPRGSFVNRQGNICVSESGQCISTYSIDGEKLATFSRVGAELGQINGCFSLTIGKDDCIYVSEYNNHRISKFSPEGEFLAVKGSMGNTNESFMNPLGIAQSPIDDNLYIADANNHRIQVFTTQLNYVRTIGSLGAGSGKFHTPHALTFDKAGNLFVCDHNHHTIQVLTPEGKFLRAFNQKANGEKLQTPRGIVIDSKGVVYITEEKFSCVSMFTTEGAFIGSFGSKGNGEGQFVSLHGISIDKNDTIIVSDTSNGRLQLY